MCFFPPEVAKLHFKTDLEGKNGISNDFERLQRSVDLPEILCCAHPDGVRTEE